jgi:hypothetical protein
LPSTLPSKPVVDINPGPGSSDSDQFLSIGGKPAFLTTFDGTARRLYRADGFDVELIRASLFCNAGHRRSQSSGQK